MSLNLSLSRHWDLGFAHRVVAANSEKCSNVIVSYVINVIHINQSP